MDSLDRHRQIVQKVLATYHQINQQGSDSEVECVFVEDQHQDHYLLLLMGWHGDERVKSVMIHVRLRNGKVWIEEDWTEDGVATDLLREWITREEIVLAFHPPHLRQYTEFAA